MVKGSQQEVMLRTMNTIPTEAAYLTRSEAADYLRLSTRTVDQLIARQELKAFHPGRKWLFRREDLDTFVERYSVNVPLTSSDEASEG
jgi:excisionase family DNA binding protein